MTTFLIVAINAVCYLIAVRWVFRGLIAAEDYHVDWEGVTVCLLMAALISLLWPIVFVYFGLRAALGTKDAETFARRLGGESSAQKLERREREVRDRERHIRELERALDLAHPKGQR